MANRSMEIVFVKSDFSSAARAFGSFLHHHNLEFFPLPIGWQTTTRPMRTFIHVSTTRHAHEALESRIPQCNFSLSCLNYFPVLLIPTVRHGVIMVTTLVQIL